MGITVLVIAAIAVVAGIIFIFSVDLPGGDNVSGGPMNKYKIITTHFQVNWGLAACVGCSWLCSQIGSDRLHAISAASVTAA